MKLSPLLNLRIDIANSVETGPGPAGQRLVSILSGGTFEGRRLRGGVLPGGGDWLLIDADGVGRLDVRLVLETDDSARVYVQYHGVLVINEKIRDAFARGGATEYGDTHFVTQPRFETGDSRYAWLNRVVAVGDGRLLPGAVEYRIFEVVHG